MVFKRRDVDWAISDFSAHFPLLNVDAFRMRVGGKTLPSIGHWLVTREPCNGVIFKAYITGVVLLYYPLYHPKNNQKPPFLVAQIMS